MATFEITGPDGKKYRVTGDTAEGAMSALRKHIGSSAQPAEKSWGQTIKDNLLGDNDPTTQNLGEKIGSLLNMGGESMTLGLVGDEASAAIESALGIGNYDDRLSHYRQQQALTEKTNPKTALAAKIAPAFIPGVGVAKGVSMAPTLAGRAFAGSASAGLMSAIYGGMEGEGGLSNRLGDAAWSGILGAALGGAIPRAGAGLQKFLDGRTLSKAVKEAARGAQTTEQLKAAGRALYDQIDNAGVQIKPSSFENARVGILDKLRSNTGFDELPGAGSLTPGSARVAEIMSQASQKMAAEPTAALPFKALDQMRRQAGAAAGNVVNKTDQKAGMEIINGLDDFVKNLKAGDVVAGDVKALQTALPKARDVWARMSKSQTIDDAIKAGEDYLSGASSGIRNQFKNILRNPKRAAKFTEVEKAAMRKVVNGSIPERLLNLAGGGLGQLTQIVGGSLGGGPLGAAIGTAGAVAARKTSEAVTKGKAQMFRDAIANGGLTSIPQASKAPAGLLEAFLFGSLPSQTLQNKQLAPR